MKIEPRREPLEQVASHQQDTTQNIEKGAGRATHRRTTVTVERETVLFLVRRAVAEAAVEKVDQPAGEESAPRPPDKNLPSASPEKRNQLSGGKP